MVNRSCWQNDDLVTKIGGYPSSEKDFSGPSCVGCPPSSFFVGRLYLVNFVAGKAVLEDLVVGEVFVFVLGAKLDAGHGEVT